MMEGADRSRHMIAPMGRRLSTGRTFRLMSDVLAGAM